MGQAPLQPAAQSQYPPVNVLLYQAEQPRAISVSSRRTLRNLPSMGTSARLAGEAASPIAHLPDLSPFRRRLHPEVSPADRSQGNEGRLDRPTKNRSQYPLHQRKKTRGSTEEDRDAERGGWSVNRKKTRSKSRSRNADSPSKIRRSTRSGSKSGICTTRAGEVSTVSLEASIPRIDIVESSPLLGNEDALVLGRTDAQSSADYPKPLRNRTDTHALPAFPRSPSMPVVLNIKAPSYHSPTVPAAAFQQAHPYRPCLARPKSSPNLASSPVLGLPLPGTPMCEMTERMLGLGSSPDQFVSRPVTPASTLTYHTDKTAHDAQNSEVEHEHDQDDAHSISSIVTTQIRILRVTNPDVVLERLEQAKPKTTLAEKRKVENLPVPILTALPPISVKLQERPALLSATPTSSSTSPSASSDLLSPSTPATSLTSPSTSSPLSKKYGIQQLSVASLHSPTTPTSPASPTRPFLVSKVRSPRRAVSSDSTGTKSKTYLIAGHAEDSDASDADQSALYSSASESASREQRKRRVKHKARPEESAGQQRKVKTALAFDNDTLLVPTVEKRQLRKVSAPALISLDLEKPAGQRTDQGSEAVLDVAARARQSSEQLLAPPRSPRPPATPTLPVIGDGRLSRSSPPSATAQLLHASSSVPQGTRHVAEEAPYNLPAPSPLRMDRFTADLLSRCGIPYDALLSQTLPSPPLTPIETIAAPSLPLTGLLPSHPSALRPGTPALHQGALEGRRFSGLFEDPLSAPTRETLLRQGAILPPSPCSARSSAVKVGHTQAGTTSKPCSNREVRADRAQRRLEREARYEAFRQLAKMAVESPYGNPFVENSNGAVRLGEYKRGFDDWEILRWSEDVQEAMIMRKREKEERRRRLLDEEYRA